MKKIFFIYIIFNSLVTCKAASQNSGKVSTNQTSNKAYRQPDSIIENPNLLNLKDVNARFYPIGWSDDGKFAYITESTNSFACDGLPTYLFIYDAVNDSIIYEYLNSCPNNFWNEDYPKQINILSKFAIISSIKWSVNILDEIKILEDDNYEIYNNKNNNRKEINLIAGYKDPNYIKYLGSLNDMTEKYTIHLMLISESESEIVLLSSNSHVKVN